MFRIATLALILVAVLGASPSFAAKRGEGIPRNCILDPFTKTMVCFDWK